MQHDIKPEATTTMRLPRDLWAAIRGLATKQDTTAVALVIEGLHLVLKEYGSVSRKGVGRGAV